MYTQERSFYLLLAHVHSSNAASLLFQPGCNKDTFSLPVFSQRRHSEAVRVALEKVALDQADMLKWPLAHLQDAGRAVTLIMLEGLQGLQHSACPFLMDMVSQAIFTLVCLVHVEHTSFRTKGNIWVPFWILIRKFSEEECRSHCCFLHGCTLNDNYTHIL